MNYKKGTRNRFILLYGSQTGQAQAIAEEISERALDIDLHADLHCLSSVDKKFNLEDELVAVFVVSTTGQGDPPDSALKFWKRLKKTTLSDRHLSHLKYCLLGLGDSNYNQFANFGKNLDRRLKQLGAVKLIESGFADDATGLDVVAEPWILNLWQPLLDFFKCKSKDVSQTHNQSIITLTNIGNSIVVENFEIDNPLKNTQTSEIMQMSEQSMSEITLRETISSLKDMNLSLPSLPKTFLKLKFDEANFESGKYPAINREFPLAVSGIKCVSLISAKKLTNQDAKKSVLEITLDINNTELSFQPGDSFGIICENDAEEVQLLIDRLDLNTLADQCVHVGPIDTDPISEKKISLQPHLPSVSSVRQMLLTCCDIRTVPKKAFIRLLVECTTDAKEKRRLQELCSRQGSEEYNSLIRENSLCVLDLLMEFKSCKPSIEMILEHLSPLQPRCYSVANYLNPGVIRCVFTLVEIKKMKGHCAQRRGVCTSWLDKISRRIQISRSNNEEMSLVAQMANLVLADSPKIGVFKRKSSGFHLPLDPKIPIVMICAGAGIAPFIGFLECRHEQRKKGITSKNWLLFGCRNEINDFLYKDEITHYCSSGTLDKFTLALSQSPTERARYVQDGIKDEAEEFVHWVSDMNAIIYVCGDVKNMMKEVRNQIEECFIHEKGLSKEAAAKFVQELLDSKLYLQDVWL